MAGKQHFVFIIRPSRAGFVDEPTAEEEQVMGEHFAYLKAGVESRKVLMAGPCIAGEDTFGLVVFKADSEADAQAFMAGDPSVKAGVQNTTLYPFRLSLLGDSGKFKD